MSTLVTLETLTEPMIIALRDSAPASGSHMHVYNDCIRALGIDPLTGRAMTPEGRRIVRGHIVETINARAVRP